MIEKYGMTWGELHVNEGVDREPPDQVWDMDDGHSCEWMVLVERRGPDPVFYLADEAHHMDWNHTGGKEDILTFRLRIYQ